ncbi:glycoside hydrolase family 6 protein [Actinoplanes sp. CA-030573]|uniref:glycoside hydrolase family 6 protein n=1 Tax=Actinoplanes sp. CA-030573 TaxID=3239898 RepID=UPI003D8DFAC1
MRRIATGALMTAAAVVFSLALVPTAAADSAPAVPAPAGGDPLSRTHGLFADPGLPAARWVAAHPADPRAAAIRTAVSSRPMAHWFTGTSDADVGLAVANYTRSAEAAGRLPVLVAYNLPGRDACGAESAGGAAGPSAYRQWIAAFAAGIHDRPAIVILEPDALGDFGCMSRAQIDDRLALLNAATRTLAGYAPNTWTYLDAGHADWTGPATMAGRLRAAGIAQVRGFAVNVSNYIGTTESRRYAARLRAALHRPAAYVIDTGRNGNGGNGQWCNPGGRRLGRISTADPAALELWIANPGNSDGRCGVAPAVPAGVFDPALAQRLIGGG